MIIEVFDIIFSGATAVLAFLALRTWRAQKRFEIDVDAIIKSKDVLIVLNELKMESFNEEYVVGMYPDVSNDILKLDENAYNSYIRLHSYKMKYLSLESEINELRKQALLVLNYSKDKELINFYRTYLAFEYEIPIVHVNFHNLILNEFISNNNYTKIQLQQIVENQFIKISKIQQPNISDEAAVINSYDNVFNDKENSFLDLLREKHLSFYFRKKPPIN